MYFHHPLSYHKSISSLSIMPLSPSIFIATITIIATRSLALTPVPVCCMAYTHIDETTLYIQGGLDVNRTPTNQFIALDLTTPVWNTSAPPWFYPPEVQLHESPTAIWHSMVATKDRRNLIMWDPLQEYYIFWSYNIPRNDWDRSWIPLDYTRQPGIRVGVDLTKGDIYIPAAIDNGTQVMMNTLGISGVSLSPMPTDLMPVPILQASFVWSVLRNSFLHYGGRSMVGNTSNPHLNEFDPTSGWTAVVCFFFSFFLGFFFFFF